MPKVPAYKSSFIYSQADEAYWNTGTPWSEGEIRDLHYAVDHGQRLNEVTVFLMRTPADVMAKAGELDLSIKRE